MIYESLRFSLIAVGVLTMCLPHGLAIASASEPSIAGYVENLWLVNPSLSLKAKLDTGAKSSSLHVRNYSRFTSRGRDWVRFSIVDTGGQTVTLERPIERVVSIRRAGVSAQRRPTVMLSICVAGQAAETEFNLADREKMNYPALIGRTFLAGRIIVDASKTYVGSGRCGKPK